MKKLLALLLLATSLFVLAGCPSGEGNEKAATDEGVKMKEFNEKAMKENPPPPGEGPSG